MSESCFYLITSHICHALSHCIIIRKLPHACFYFNVLIAFNAIVFNFVLFTLFSHLAFILCVGLLCRLNYRLVKPSISNCISLYLQNLRRRVQEADAVPE